MTPERWRLVKNVFEQASGLAGDAQREFVDTACGHDDELRAEVASLLCAHATADAIVDRSAAEYLSSNTFDAANEDWRGRRVGAYELLACLGRGGMGEVWRARRADTQYEKEVAIKLVRVGYDSAFVLQRFKAERQILATLEHPNIARLVDGGMTAEGQPYLVMELVDGRPIDEYCDSQNLNLAERLRLFREVCAAVSYAHQRLVVHRDLKPANILVSTDGTIKLLDFGIAKLLQAPAADGTPADATRTSMHALTPAFSSPEQILGLPITTASDVYSLGVVLFHLLAGRSPYRTTLASTRDAIRDVCETEPPRPSSTAAALDRDLDDITLKALRKEPEKRYSSVEQLSEDLRRHLAGLPVIARGDKFAYRAEKFFHRHRIELAAAMLVAAALIVGMVAAIYEASVANAQRARAERHFASVRALANTFMFQMDGAIKNLPGSTAARELLVKTALTYLDTLSKESGSDPSLQLELAQAYDKVGDVQGENNAPNTGQAPGAVSSYDKAIALLTPLAAATSANDPAKILLALDHLKRSRALVTINGNARAAAAESQQGLLIFEQLAAANAGDPAAQRRLAAASAFHAVHLMWSGETAPAIAAAYKSIDILEALRRTAPADIDVLFRLATAYSDAGVVVTTRGVDPSTIDESLLLTRKGLDLAAQGMSAAPQYALPLWRVIGTAQGNVGNELYERGDFAGALREYQAAGEALAKTQVDARNFQARFDAPRLEVHRAIALFALGDTEQAAAIQSRAVAALRELAELGANLELEFHLGSGETCMGQIEMRRAAGAAAPSRQLLHWHAAHDWFVGSLPRYQRVLQGVILIPQDKARYTIALAGLSESTAAISRLESQSQPPKT